MAGRAIHHLPLMTRTSTGFPPTALKPWDPPHGDGSHRNYALLDAGAFGGDVRRRPTLALRDNAHYVNADV